MPPYKIEIGDFAEFRGKEYRIARKLPEMFVLRDVNELNASLFLEHADIDGALAEGTLRFLPRHAVPTMNSIVQARYKRIACDLLLDLFGPGTVVTERAIEEAMPALRRAWLCFRLNDPASGALGRTKGKGRMPHPSTVRRWLKLYDGTEASLLPENASRRRDVPLRSFDRRLASLVEETAAICVDDGSPSVTWAYRLLRLKAVHAMEIGGKGGHEPVIPSLSTFRRVVARLKAEGVRRNREGALIEAADPSSSDSSLAA